jgi:SpoVK/Ycf46/Vps4 family AAA+-type ATPase
MGQSESNMRNALRLAESLAPSILWIDEIEKGMSGLGGSDATDSGVTARVLSTFLTWMQERKATVFVVATANQVRRLPPEFLRKGRFDEIFYIDLPTRPERAEIAAIHLARRKKDPTKFDVAGIAAASEGYTGADLEAAIKESVEEAFADGKECTTESVLSVMKRIVPLSVTMREEIAFLRQWQEGRARPASSRKE